MKRYLSPVLVPADTENGTLVSVSADGRHFTVTLGKRQLRTDFLTGALIPLPAEQASAAVKASDWLRRQYPVWKDAPSGRFSAAVGTEKTSPGKPQSLHIITPRRERSSSASRSLPGRARQGRGRRAG